MPDSEIDVEDAWIKLFFPCIYNLYFTCFMILIFTKRLKINIILIVEHTLLYSDSIDSNFQQNFIKCKSNTPRVRIINITS